MRKWQVIKRPNGGILWGVAKIHDILQISYRTILNCENRIEHATLVRLKFAHVHAFKLGVRNMRSMKTLTNFKLIT